MDDQWRCRGIEEDWFLTCSESWGAKPIDVAKIKYSHLLSNNCSLWRAEGTPGSNIERLPGPDNIHKTISHR